MPSIVDIDPGVLASIRDFDWMIRSLALGEYHGKKVSKRLGTGMEFSQYRPYSQGDDLRQLDWKMYARSGKFYIKQSEVETNISVTFIIDHSNSMAYQEEGWSKLDFSKVLVGVLAHVAMQNGDWINLSDGETLRADNSARHWKRILLHLSEMSCKDRFETPYIENKRSKELFVVLSDLYQEDDELTSFIYSLKSRRNEVIVFQPMGMQEESLEFGTAVKFKDLEHGNSLQLNTETYRASYQHQLQEWQADLQHEFVIRGIDFHPVHFQDNIDDIVNAFVNHRKQLA